ncbi:probable hydrolase [Synechococcus elongatus PCC 6301]|uniref:Ribonuclease J n=1 Tax=Synechococcus sp. (strain ATCC 27144 / PCC 6301 / SAUG 1402/1) TaxID=269084 RepID=A0A0H3K4W1_SYNP6|nr:ribonuclease J [Synechococcus elongatus]BAD80438.1 probable hydrolase [Synechococcus elongatus PCC 6301]
MPSQKPIIVSKTSAAASSSSDRLRIIPLGGLHEIGKNTCIYEVGDEILLVDAGLAFPTDGMHGVNVVLPDMTYLRENQHRIKAMVVTHGHEDHIGGIPFHLRQLDIPIIYGPRLAMALLAGKLEEAGVVGRANVKTVQPREVVRIGQNFLVEFIRNTHSIADSFTLAIRTPLGVVIHTGDFKFDHTPVDGETFDIQRLADYGEQGVLCLVSDSTNAELPGFTPSERSVFPNLDRAFSQAQGRLIVTTFASSVHRVNMILELAKKHGRKVTVLGRSMLNVIAHARNLGYIHCSDDLFLPPKELRDHPDRDVLILTTGSQGEPLAALTRIARQEHPQVKIRQGDTVIFSANPIPGNTISVVNTIDQLMMQGAHVVYGKGAGIHVSGHGCQEDQKLMIALTKPKFFVPVHGEHRMLVQHCKTAQSMGVPPEHMIVIDNGDTVELTPESIGLGDRVTAGIELVDTSRTGLVDGKALKERQQLAEDGLVSLSALVNSQGQLVDAPTVHLRGVVTSADPRRVSVWAQKEVEMALDNRWADYCRRLPSGELDVDWVGLHAEVEVGMQRRLKRELQCVPMILCTLQSVPSVAAQPAEEDNRMRRRRSSAPIKVGAKL